MRDHFVITSWARDAVAEGNLALLREPLRALSQYRYPGVIPGAWMQFLAQLQAAAKATAEAQQLPAAAAGVATMARICGQCHIQQRVELTVDFHVPSAHPEPEVESLSARMYRHEWASTRLWEGITVPSERAWQAGAAALVDIPLAAPQSANPLAPEVEALLREVRSVGVEASEASTLEQKATSYAHLLALCAQCHAARGGRLH